MPISRDSSAEEPSKHPDLPSDPAPNCGPTDTPPSVSLAEALGRCGIALPPEQIGKLDGYCRLLWRWNERMNLTRHTDYDKFVARDLLDSLAFSRALARGERVLDVGTGGGVPGVILAIIRPDLKVEMCESIGKKARAVAEMVAELGIKAPVHHARAEAVLAERSFDDLVIRAVAPLKTLLEWFRPYWSRFRRMLVLKGPSWLKERGQARHFGLLRDKALRRIDEYINPATGATSVLLAITLKERQSPAKNR